MLLALDVGNTQTVVGLYDLEADDDVNLDRRQADTSLVDHWRIATNVERTADEHALVLQEFLAFHGFTWDEHDIEGIALCSSVPRVTGSLRRMSERYFGFAALVVEPGIRTGLPILYDNPKEVGADRIADAVAAFDLYGGPTIVVDFGTATTFEAVSAKGEYLGGAIFPGIDISLDALFARAAALRRVELVEPRSVIGRTLTGGRGAGRGVSGRMVGRNSIGLRTGGFTLTGVITGDRTGRGGATVGCRLPWASRGSPPINSE